jgi:serine/threonine protein kinase
VAAGDPLADWARRDAPDAGAALAVLLQVADGLAHLHSAGVVHNNIKPENVLWLPTVGAWLLADLGYAARFGRALPQRASLACASAHACRSTGTNTRLPENCGCSGGIAGSTGTVRAVPCAHFSSQRSSSYHESKHGGRVVLPERVCAE